MRALAKSNELLWTEADRPIPIDEIINKVVVETTGQKNRISFSGDSAIIPPSKVLPIVLALHELTTNCMKHGALSGKTGSVTIKCNLDACTRVATISWHETGGPPVTPPINAGFGSRLLQRLLAHEFHSSVKHEFLPDGVWYELTVPVGMP